MQKPLCCWKMAPALLLPQMVFLASFFIIQSCSNNVMFHGCNMTLTQVPCVFPFIFKEMHFESCTDYKDPDGRLWCSTRTDNNDNHIGSSGHWGYCHPLCGEDMAGSRLVAPDQSKDCTSTVAGPKTVSPCVFPFIFMGETFRSCTGKFDPEGRPWCSTKTDRNNRHVQSLGEWGYCNTSCLPSSKLHDVPSSSSSASRKPGGSSAGKVNQGRFQGSAAGSSRPLPSGTSCGFSTRLPGYVLGGEEAYVGEFPFVARLGYRSSKSPSIAYLCGGVLINSRYVLTTAHCQDTTRPETTISVVLLGDYDISKDPDCPDCPRVQKFDVSAKDVLVHEEYALNRVTREGHDIALIRLPRQALTADKDSSQLTLPVCIDWSGERRLPLKENLVTGWGRTNNRRSDLGSLQRGGSHAKILQKLKVPVLDGGMCLTRFSSLNFLHPLRHLCAGGEPGKDSCSGDSGGPLISRKDHEGKMYLIGLVSFGSKVCGRGLPGVYTNVAHYRDWLNNNMVS